MSIEFDLGEIRRQTGRGADALAGIRTQLAEAAKVNGEFDPAEVLVRELAAVRGELVRVDAKCSMLAALAGGAAAFTATQAGGHGPLGVRVLFALAGVVLVAATVLLLVAVIRPRLGTSGFCRYADMPSGELATLFAPASGGGLDRVRRGDVHKIELADLKVLSGLVKRKYTRMRQAVDLAAAGLAVLGLAVVAGVIA